MINSHKHLYFSLLIFLVSILTTHHFVYATQEVPSERLVQRPIIQPSEVTVEKGEWNLSSYYEHSNVVQGSRPGRWTELTNYVGYRYRDMQGYFSVSQLRRFDDKDYTANFGTYMKLANYYIHEEFGFGWDVKYIYRLQNILEVNHKLYKNLFWQAGYNYRAYFTGDTYLLYPGLIYYFGDNSVGVNYGLSFIESRGAAQYGILRSDIALTKFLRWSLGTAIGERLYDIYGLKASKEYGYIIFTAANLEIAKDISFRVGYSYGTERPHFIKRSLNLGLSLKF